MKSLARPALLSTCGQEVVDTPLIMAVGQQALAEMPAEEATGHGDEGGVISFCRKRVVG